MNNILEISRDNRQVIVIRGFSTLSSALIRFLFLQAYDV